MQSSLYVALSAQVALQERLETVAQNVANVKTAGYRGTEVKFDSGLSNLGADPVAFVSSGSQDIETISIRTFEDRVRAAIGAKARVRVPLSFARTSPGTGT